MQFTSIVAVLSMALAVTARPNGSPPPTTPAECTQSGGSVQCCTTSGGISILECGVIPLLTCGILNGGQQACCKENASGILDIQLCSLL